MGARELLHALDGAGFQVLAEGGALLVRPLAALSPGLRREIFAHKPELLDIAARRRWRVTVPSRDAFGINCVQGTTRDELLERYPAGTLVEPLP